LFVLAAFVVLFAGVALLATGAVGRPGRATATPTTQDRLPAPTMIQEPTVSKSPPACAAHQLVISGAFSECATQRAGDSQDCTESGSLLSDVLTVRGTAHSFLLYLEVDGGYTGPRDYYLAPWTSGLGVLDGRPKVAIREYETGAFWQSVSGTLWVSPGGRSGGVAVNLTFVGGEPTPPVVQLGVLGPWHC
jgi:hypothetical protein